ncbi:hypothetical protein CA85_10840 [Allorhodopirellula solitaria]|uniref:Uncharacterized protein n=1 Tax=Allorhodopirellula solitaria TaxID=2527987 RepID=A0A5C5YEL9_9BACT|nr:hypothetical protein CA85_10840 [Allorhodopirellula solitaria]
MSDEPIFLTDAAVQDAVIAGDAPSDRMIDIWDEPAWERAECSILLFAKRGFPLDERAVG